VNKKSIEQHEECLRNFSASRDRYVKERDRLNLEIIKMTDEIIFRLKQIDEAKKRGLIEFDGDRLLVKRERKENK
jgi:hypothetical protein